MFSPLLPFDLLLVRAAALPTQNKRGHFDKRVQGWRQRDGADRRYDRVERGGGFVRDGHRGVHQGRSGPCAGSDAEWEVLGTDATMEPDHANVVEEHRMKRSPQRWASASVEEF
jgi:hypothetical protein